MRKSDFSQKIPITRFKIYVFKISAKFLNCLHQHFFRALPSPVNIVCNRGCSFFFLPLSPSNSLRPLFSRYSPIICNKWKLHIRSTKKNTNIWLQIKSSEAIYYTYSYFSSLLHIYTCSAPSSMLTVPHLFCFVSVERVALSAKEPLMQTTEQVPKKPQTASHTSY